MSGPGDVRAEGARSVAVGGDVRSGAVIVTGDHNLVIQVDGENAILLERLLAQRLPARVPRPTPLDQRPPRSPSHVDRVTEAAELVAAIQEGRPVELHGAAEIGKTYVVADVLSRHDPAFLPDGVVYVFAKGKALRDLLQELWEAFYDCRPRYVAGEPELREGLRDRRALLVLDSHELQRDELQQLVMAAPGCRFVLASRRRVLWEGPAVEVRGLATPDALAIIEQELGRALAEDERPAAERVCETLRGNPLKLRQAGAQVREGSASFADLTQAEGALQAAMVNALPPRDRDLVELVATLESTSAGVERLAELTGDAGAGARLEALERRRYVRAENGRYRAAGVVEEPPAGVDTVTRAVSVLAHFIEWAPRQPPEAVVAEIETLRTLLRIARPAEVIALARVASNAFASSLRWGTWGDVLDAALNAAREINDDEAVAWALHQRGTRAFCLGDADGAVVMLENALALREGLGDARGAEASRHNLEFIRGGGPGRDDDRTQPREPDRDEDPPPPPQPSDGGGWRVAVGAAVAVLVAGVIAAVTLAGGDDGEQRTEARGERTPVPVEIQIDSPLDGERYPAGTRVIARYSCSGDARTCRGDVADGAPVDTSRGSHVFTVRATDGSGETITKEVSYTAFARPVPDRIRPEIVIEHPQPQTTFEVGTPVPVKFTCTDKPSNRGLRCSGRVHPTKDPSTARAVKSGQELTDLPAGTYTLEVTAVDRAGNHRLDDVTFEVVDKHEPPPTVTPTPTPTATPTQDPVIG